ncbi:MAG: PaaI family thioesterase [Candidatus Hydrogenedentes bacterium]|nr:PaaI family thioesterase [Candidatus Hydrogenedentota bacterium]
MQNSNHRKYLPHSQPCFVCGEENHAGLHLRFYIEEDEVRTRWNAREHHCGYGHVVHGGVTAAVLDECMAWAAARAIVRSCVTGELTVRYLRPVPDTRELTACAKVEKASRRLVFVNARLVDDDGLEYARAHGRFLPLSVEETLRVDDNLIYRGGEERIFDELRATTQAGARQP